LSIKPAGNGVKALSMNFAALGLDPAARRPEDPAMQAKGDLEAHHAPTLPLELYSLSNWYKSPVRPITLAYDNLGTPRHRILEYEVVL